MTEIEMGKLAETKATNPAVKNFGKMMVVHHTEIAAQLKMIAAEDKIELPTALDEKHQKKVSELAAMSGPAFDKAYMDDMVKAHDKTVRLFNEASETSSNGQLKKFALAILPKIQAHLEEAKAIQKNLKG